jgi:CheY-like chemotaxis protein
LKVNDKIVILLAEDDDGHAVLTRSSLRRVGINNEIIRFRNGQEILDFLFTRAVSAPCEVVAPYLVLLDLWMPKVDGLSVLRQIKQDQRLQHIPVIVLSTTDNPSQVEACLDLQCTRYIVKPADYKDFVEAMMDVQAVLECGQLLATTHPDP